LPRLFHQTDIQQPFITAAVTVRCCASIADETIFYGRFPAGGSPQLDDGDCRIEFSDAAGAWFRPILETASIFRPWRILLNWGSVGLCVGAFPHR